MKTVHAEIKQTLEDLKGVCESLKGYATKLKSIISDPKVKEETFKVIRMSLGKCSVVGEVLKTTQVEPSQEEDIGWCTRCLLYTSPSPRDGLLSRMPSSA